MKNAPKPLLALDFFAGCGLVRLGLEDCFETVWANDICAKKAAVYAANFPASVFHLGDINAVQGGGLPAVDLAWASFPCQDLSLAGTMSGIKSGTRSGLFWQWIRILKELQASDKRPPVLCVENVIGFLSAGNGAHFKAAYSALRRMGYRAGAIVVDASWFLPQSRPRAFLVAVSGDIELAGFTQDAPSAPFHSRPVIEAAAIVNDSKWIWWSLPEPHRLIGSFAEMCEKNAPCDSLEKTAALLTLLSIRNQAKLNAALQKGTFLAGAGYRRTRYDEDGNKSQRLEIRFDGIAGCLRTPEGGSSRQIVLTIKDGEVHSRLMTIRECARLMGAGDGYVLPGSYNDGYRAMGDGVAVPVTRFLAEHLLRPLALRKVTFETI